MPRAERSREGERGSNKGERAFSALLILPLPPRTTAAAVDDGDVAAAGITSSPTKETVRLRCWSVDDDDDGLARHESIIPVIWKLLDVKVGMYVEMAGKGGE